MQTHFLFDLMAAYPPYQRIEAHAKEKGAVIAASGMTRAQKIHLACTLSRRTGRPILFLCDSERAAGAATEDMTALLGGGVSQFPARDITFYHGKYGWKSTVCTHRLLHWKEMVASGNHVRNAESCNEVSD